MVAVVEERREAIRALCRKYGVRKLYVFGSATRDDFRPGESDVDLLVDFGTMPGHDKAHAYFDLLAALQDALNTDVDLVMIGAVKKLPRPRDRADAAGALCGVA